MKNEGEKKKKLKITSSVNKNTILNVPDKEFLKLNANSLSIDTNKQSLNYLPAIEYLTTQSSKISTLISQVGLLGTTIDKIDMPSVISGVRDQIASFTSILSYLPKVDNQSSYYSFVDLTRQATLAISSLAMPSVVSMMANTIINDNHAVYNGSMGKSTSSFTYLSLSPSYSSKDLASVIGMKSLSELSIQSNVCHAATFSILAEKSLHSVTELNFGSRIGLLGNQKSYLAQSLKDLSGSYLGLQTSFANNPSSYSNINPSITRVIPIDYYSNTKIIQAISANELSIPVLEQDLSHEIHYENEILLKEYLPKLDIGLYQMWKGAIEAFHSSNSDRIRHFSVSIRELYTHLLHLLAPDKAIKIWTCDPSLFYNGNPTRKARLQYICRNVNNGALADFFVKDIQSTLAFIDIFQEGTHKISPVFSPDEMILIKSKAETNLKFILHIHFEIKK